jgi:NADPH2:quinone reductase
VLVSGATGGVGAFALQMATAKGVTVLATARSGAGADHVRRLGAGHVVDYTGDLTAQVRRIAPDGVDVVLHFAGDAFALADLLAEGGRFVSLLSVGQDQLAGRPIAASAVYATPHRDLLETLGSAVAAGRLAIPVQRSYALAESPRAFTDFAAGKLGKLAVSID